MSDKEKDPEILGALLEEKYEQSVMGDICIPVYVEGDLGALLEEKYEQIEMLLDVIRDIYSIRGEDKEISDRCNRVLCDTRFISTISL